MSHLSSWRGYRPKATFGSLAKYFSDANIIRIISFFARSAERSGLREPAWCFAFEQSCVKPPIESMSYGQGFTACGFPPRQDPRPLGIAVTDGRSPGLRVSASSGLPGRRPSSYMKEDRVQWRDVERCSPLTVAGAATVRKPPDWVRFVPCSLLAPGPYALDRGTVWRRL